MDEPSTDLARRALKGLAWFALALAAMICLPAWSLTFWAGWLVWALFMGGVLAITLYFLRRDPDLIERRMKSGPGAEREPTQKRIQAVASVLFPALFVLSALDHRLGWSSAPASVLLFGDGLIVVGFAVIFRVFQKIPSPPRSSKSARAKRSSRPVRMLSCAIRCILAPC